MRKSKNIEIVLWNGIRILVTPNASKEIIAMFEKASEYVKK